MLRPDGKALRFTLQGGSWIANGNITGHLTQLKNGTTLTGWRYYDNLEGVVEDYDASGLLLTLTNLTGNTLRFSYSDGTGGIQYAATPHANGYKAPTCPNSDTAAITETRLLLCISDQQGRQLSFGYNSSVRIGKITDALGQVTQYAYDGNANLTSVTYPDGAVKTYAYENTTYPNALTGITDENGAAYITYGYDDKGRAVSESLTNGVGALKLAFGSNSTTVTDALGTARSYTFQTILGSKKSTGSNQPGGSGCSAAASAQTYDANGNIASRTDFNGNRTTYSYDLARNLETQRVEASGTAQARTLSTQWHATWRLPTKIAEPLKTTTYTYNGDGTTCAPASAVINLGNSTVPIAVLCQKTEQATGDANGSQGFAATASGSARTWRYTYNATGQILTITGPRSDVADVTTATYYADDDPDLGKRGNLATLTNALGHVTRFTAYDATGRLLTRIDPNGLATTFAYDPRGRLTSRTVGTETTTYQYDGVGQLTQLTLPDNGTLTYTYDAAHRLTGISDSLGNQITYTLDVMGNRIKEDTLDPSGQLALTRRRAYDALNRLYQDIGAQNQITQYAYDPNGNLTGVTDPLNHTTTRQYDALNRLIRTLDPAGGQTQLAYNGQDRLVQVTDPRNLVTAYTLDGLGNLTRQSSPDTGITQHSHDPAGNLTQRTDAKGQITATQYDALNRPTRITYQDGREERRTWDQGANGIGRLAKIDELEGGQVVVSTAYAYDSQGRLSTQTRTLNNVTYITRYRYTTGRLTGMTYPSGKQLDYTLDGMGQIADVTLTDNGQARSLAYGIQYNPFGGVKSWITGAGQTVSFSRDTDGRTTRFGLDANAWTLGYDAAGRIIYQTDTRNAANTVTYGYDSLDRLTSAVLPTTTYGYAYDATGNRIRQTIGATTIPYQISPISNQLTAINGTPPKSLVYDANGSLMGDGQTSYGYDARGRMNQSQGAAGLTTYRIDALGQRIRKTAGTDDSVYHYDQAGHLIAETSPGGQTRREYIWLDDLPVAVLQ